MIQNSPIGVEIAIEIGIERIAITELLDFDPDPDSDFDEFTGCENFLS